MRQALLVVLAAFLVLGGCSPAQPNREVLYQYATLGALLEGGYDGSLSVGELKKRGDLGLGTFNGLDGEMVQLGGTVYQIRSDGVASVAADSVLTPFAAVTFFDADRVVTLDRLLDCKQMEEYIDGLLPSKNIPVALKIEGEFQYVKARSVPRQQRPYPKLVEVVKNQPTFEFRNAKGEMVGFRLPAYLEGLNAVAYHLHFITADRKSGGHVLECRVEGVKISLDYTAEMFVQLPESGDFYTLDLSTDKRADTQKVER